jgi:hypothetical protein
LIWKFVSAEGAVSFVAGSAVSITNFLLIFWLISRIFAKKQVALSSLIIVFKYLILGLIIYFLITQTEIQLFWFGAGLISLLVTIGLTSAQLTALMGSSSEKEGTIL